MRKLNRFLTGLLLTVLSACASVSAPSAVPSLIPSEIPTSTVAPSSTERLPFRPDPSDAGCGEYIASLPVQEVAGLAQEELAQKLFEMYLEHYRSSGLGSACRLKDFKVEHVILDERIAYLANEQHVDVVGTVQFSVQVEDVPSDWVAGNGELAEDGWIIHKGLIVGVSKSGNQYILKLIGTGP